MQANTPKGVEQAPSSTEKKRTAPFDAPHPTSQKRPASLQVITPPPLPPSLPVHLAAFLLDLSCSCHLLLERVLEGIILRRSLNSTSKDSSILT